LVEIFLKKLKKYYPKEIHGIHPDVIDAFNNYGWPGNIRELENLMERAFILEASTALTPGSFPNELFDHEIPGGIHHLNATLTLAEVRQHGIENIERNYLKEILNLHRGKINESADHAGITPRQLNKLMNKYGIRKEEFKSKLAPGLQR
jgi:DNA-binding NtrC family response regulator